MIKAVFFDLDGTVRHNVPSGGDVFADIAARLGLRIREDDRLRANRWEHFYWAYSLDMIEDLKTHDGRDEDFWDAYARRHLVALGASRTEAEKLAIKVNTHMMKEYKPASVIPEDATRALTRLKQQGYRLALISNRDKAYDEEVAQLGLTPYFEFALAGADAGAFKPQPEIFLQGCARMKVAPAEAAYVGDNYFADVVGSRAAGLTPVLYDPKGVFDDPECAVIKSFDELDQVLDLTNHVSA